MAQRNTSFKKGITPSAVVRSMTHAMALTSVSALFHPAFRKFASSKMFSQHPRRPSSSHMTSSRITALLIIGFCLVTSSSQLRAQDWATTIGRSITSEERKSAQQLDQICDWTQLYETTSLCWGADKKREPVSNLSCRIETPYICFGWVQCRKKTKLVDNSFVDNTRYWISCFSRAPCETVTVGQCAYSPGLTEGTTYIDKFRNKGN